MIDEADRMMASITDNWLAALESAVYRYAKYNSLFIFFIFQTNLPFQRHPKPLGPRNRAVNG